MHEIHDGSMEEEEQKTLVSFSIIGDSFADIVCFSERLPILGGDVRLEHPGK